LHYEYGIVPNLVLAEVAGAINRTRNDPVRAEAFATTLGRLPNVTVVALDVALGDQARVLAAQYGFADHSGCSHLSTLLQPDPPATFLLTRWPKPS